MNQLTEETKNILVEKYGPLLTLNQLAEVLDRSPNGLRISLSQKSEFSKEFSKAKRKIGRRVYFNAIILAEIMTTDISI